MPLVIEDTEFTNRPTTDRTHLVSIIKFLAKRVHDELKADMETNRRLARRLIISNRLTPEEAAAAATEDGGELIEEREQILVKLPYRVDTWNELDEDDIEFEICKAVVNIHDEYAWFKVRVLLDQYIDLATRRLIDILEVKEDDPLAAAELERNIDSREPSISDLDEDMLLGESLDDARANPAQGDDVPEAVVATKIEVIEDEPTVAAEIIEDDSKAADERTKGDEDASDEDVMFVCEVPKPTPPKSKPKSKPAKAAKDTVLTPTTAQIELINNRIKSLHTKRRS